MRRIRRTTHTTALPCMSVRTRLRRQNTLLRKKRNQTIYLGKPRKNVGQRLRNNRNHDIRKRSLLRTICNEKNNRRSRTRPLRKNQHDHRRNNPAPIRIHNNEPETGDRTNLVQQIQRRPLSRGRMRHRRSNNETTAILRKNVPTRGTKTIRTTQAQPKKIFRKP